MTHVTAWNLGRCGRNARSARGFTLLELLIVVVMMCTMAAMAVALTPYVIRLAKGEGATTQVKTFLSRVREAAVTKRRNIQITFPAANQLTAEEMPIAGVPVAADRFLETLTLEGGAELLKFPEIPDTPDLFGMATAINLGGAEMVLFTSEGTFTDINGDPVNVTLGFGLPDEPRTAQAITILGVSAVVRHWRWNGSEWVH
jgi:prepilin-type N-terminal cleavage/methylation domain-containing protein